MIEVSGHEDVLGASRSTMRAGTSATVDSLSSSDASPESRTLYRVTRERLLG